MSESKSYDDDGPSKSLHRKDGKTVYSQNAKQAVQNRAAYIIRDNDNRVREFGEILLSGTFGSLNPDSPLPSAFPRIEQTYIDYETSNLANEETASGWTQAQKDYFGKQTFMLGLALETRNANSTTWNSYDELGRVKWTIQKVSSFPQTNKLFTTEYLYDFAGNVKEVVHNAYRAGEAAYHRYTYDEDANLLRAEFKEAGNVAWKQQAQYDYYTHGPLKRNVLGNRLQGLDYTYTTTGQLKAINHPDLAQSDPGLDGFSHAHVAPDIFGMAIDYYEGDYQRNNTNMAQMDGHYDPAKEQWNGLIQSVRWNTASVENANPTPMINSVKAQAMYQYTYDHLYQLQEGVFGSFYNGASANGNHAFVDWLFHPSDDYHEWGLNYDKNGNIKALNRNAYAAGAGGLDMDQLNYVYDASHKNRLLRVIDNVAGGGNGAYNDVKTGTGTQYQYDELGNMIADNQENIQVEYNAYGDIAHISHFGKHVEINYLYNESGQRIEKVVLNTKTSVTHYTWYVRDASGTLLSLYENTSNSSTSIPVQTEVPVYALGRVGRTVKFGKKS